MTPQSDQPRWPQRRQTRSDRLHNLLDWLDARVARIGSAIWRVVIEGFAAYATAQYVPMLHLESDVDVNDKAKKIVDRDMIPAFLIQADSEIVMHDDLQSLIKSISEMDHQTIPSRPA